MMLDHPSADTSRSTRAKKRTALSRLRSTERSLNSLQSWLLLLPIIALFGFVFIAPVLGVVGLSLFDPNFTLEYYELLFTEEVFLRVLWRTLWVSALVALLALLLGYSVASLMASLSGWLALLIAGCVLVPLWLSILVRSYAWVVLLSTNGVVVTFLRNMGIIDETTRLIFTDFAVVLAMTHVLLPFMILPLYAALSSIPRGLSLAAISLGASPLRTFFEVTLPLSLPGVYSGTVLVFVLALGFFVTPQLVGGSNSMMMSMLITREAVVGNNWGLASALSIVLFSIALLIVLLVGYLTRGSSSDTRDIQ